MSKLLELVLNISSSLRFRNLPALSLSKGFGFRNSSFVFAFLSLGIVLCGCTREITVNPIDTDAAKNIPIPMALRGQYTALKLEFPKGKQTIQPGQFRQDEVCYLKIGNLRIDCYTDGSSLNLGLNDSTDLLTDNGAWNLAPADENNKQGEQLLQTYAIVCLVGGSVDRLPATLSDYLQNPGQHLSDALDLTSRLLSEKQIRLDGFARGGNFTVTMELNDSGREKLLDGLDEIGEAGGDLQFVRRR